MSWLRLDDGFGRHPKVLELREADRWRWVTLLLDCARHGREGRVTLAMLREAGLERRRGLLLSMQLLDDVEGTLYVHDWDDYNAVDNARALRQKRYRLRRAGVSEEEVQRVAPPRDGAFRYVTEDVFKDVVRDVTEESHPRARSPSPTPKELTTTTSSTTDSRGDWGSWNSSQRAQGEADPERAQAWLEHARRTADITNPPAFAWAGFKGGGWPEPEVETVAAGASGTRSYREPVDYIERCRRFIASPTWDEATSEEAIREDVERIAAKHGAELGAGELVGLLTMWKGLRERRYGGDMNG